MDKVELRNDTDRKWEYLGEVEESLPVSGMLSDEGAES